MTIDFAPPTADKTNFTVLIWGADGVGKTPTVLRLAENFAPAAVCDADGGLAPYLDPDNKTIRLIQSEDPIYVRSQFEALAAAPGDFKLAAIDPITTIDQRLRALVDARERTKPAGRGLGEFESALHPGSWIPIHSRGRDILRIVRWIGIPFIVTAREDNEWSGGQIVGLKPAGPKGLGHDFTLNVRMMQTTPNGPRRATLVRDRLHRFPPTLEAPADNPFFVADKIIELYPDKLGGSAIERPRCSDDVALEIHKHIRELHLNHKAMHARLKSEYGVDSVEDLSPEAAGDVLEALRDKSRARSEAAAEARS